MSERARTQEMTDVSVKHRAPFFFFLSTETGGRVIFECQCRFNRDSSSLSERVTYITKCLRGDH